MAIAENERLTLSFTYFYEKTHINFRNVIKVNFLNASMISVDSYDIFKRDDGPEFKSYGITLDISMRRQGKEVLESLSIVHADGTIDILPVGTWVFECGQEDCGLLDTWESPALSSNPEEFVYIYSLKNKDVIVKEIQYAENQRDSDINVSGTVISGTADLPSNAPMKFIKSKITLRINNQTLVSYGKGCYCGAMNVTEASIFESKKYSNARVRRFQ